MSKFKPTYVCYVGDHLGQAVFAVLDSGAAGVPLLIHLQHRHAGVCSLHWSSTVSRLVVRGEEAPTQLAKMRAVSESADGRRGQRPAEEAREKF